MHAALGPMGRTKPPPDTRAHFLYHSIFIDICMWECCSRTLSLPGHQKAGLKARPSVNFVTSSLMRRCYM